MWTILIVFIEFIKIFVSVLYFGFFGCKACGILVPPPEIKTTHTALEGKVLTSGPPRKSIYVCVCVCVCVCMYIYSFSDSFPL